LQIESVGVRKSDTVIMIKHNLDMIKTAKTNRRFCHAKHV
jgi:excinuclease UvrABC ATPase subunit